MIRERGSAIVREGNFKDNIWSIITILVVCYSLLILNINVVYE